LLSFGYCWLYFSYSAASSRNLRANYLGKDEEFNSKSDLSAVEPLGRHGKVSKVEEQAISAYRRLCASYLSF
jgi:hypothetical protein